MNKFYSNVFATGDYVYVRGYDENGKRVQDRVPYEPRMFISDNNAQSGFKNIHGQNVKQVDFSTIKEARDWVKQYKDVSNVSIYGYDRWEYMYIYDNYKREVPDTTLLKKCYLDIEVDSSDGFPHPNEADKQVTAIAMVIDKRVIVLGIGEFDEEKARNNPKFSEHISDDTTILYADCKSEYVLLKRFLDIWHTLDVDVISGWNTEFFDIPYLVNRISKILSWNDAKRLSPWNRIREYTVNDQTGYEIYGISHLDYLQVYKKFCLAPRESYRLDAIAELELGRKKLDYSEYGSLHELHRQNYQQYIEYNIIDSVLVQDLEDHLGYMDVTFALTYDSGCNHKDGLSTLTIWDTIIHNYLMDRNIVIPARKPSGGSFNKIAGGFVKEPKPGMYEWVMSFDLNSLYPHLIMQYNISPDTVVNKGTLMGKITPNHFSELLDITGSCNVDTFLRKQHDTSVLSTVGMTVTPNGQLYKTDQQGFLVDLMKRNYETRTMFKKRMIEYKKKYEKNPTYEIKREITRAHNMQYAMKILLNSAYGAVANKYFRWFEQMNAEAITLSGQLSIRWIEHAINGYLNKIIGTTATDYVVAVDTDSVYINFAPLVKQVFPKDTDKVKIVNFLDKIAREKFEPFIDKSYQELADYTNAREQQMVMKRENIGDKAIWTAKKRYIMHVFDSEGVRYAEPKLKIMGIEAIRSSTPSACREEIKKTLKMIMTTDERTVQRYISNLKREFKKLPFEDVAFPRSFNVSDYADPKTIYRSGTPIQVKAGLLYNHYIKENGLERVLEEIKDGEKIKFCYLKQPNPVKNTVIGYPAEMPKEFDLTQYIDYNLQFEKGYLSPIQNILDVIGWTPEEVNTLESFFG